MDENRIAGTARNIGGKVEEGVGRLTGDTKTQIHGIADQAVGTAQDLYGQARDTAADAAASRPVRRAEPGTHEMGADAARALRPRHPPADRSAHRGRPGRGAGGDAGSRPVVRTLAR